MKCFRAEVSRWVASVAWEKTRAMPGIRRRRTGLHERLNERAPSTLLCRYRRCFGGCADTRRRLLAGFVRLRSRSPLPQSNQSYSSCSSQVPDPSCQTRSASAGAASVPTYLFADFGLNPGNSGNPGNPGYPIRSSRIRLPPRIAVLSASLRNDALSTISSVSGQLNGTSVP